MRKFQFNLDKVLELRKYHERQCELKLGEITGKCNALQHRIQQNKEQKREVFSRRQLEGRDIRSFLYVEYYTQRMNQEIEQLQRELEVAEVERRKAQEEFLEASKQRKILDSLKERQQRSYYRKQQLVEQKMLDEISASMYIRKMEDAG